MVRGAAWLYNKLPISNDVFTGKPEEILALRKCLRWSRADLGAVLGLYINAERRDCYGVYRWERGLCRPHPVFMSKLVSIVEMFRAEYLATLNILQPSNHSEASSSHKWLGSG